MLKFTNNDPLPSLECDPHSQGHQMALNFQASLYLLSFAV